VAIIEQRGLELGREHQRTDRRHRHADDGDRAQHHAEQRPQSEIGDAHGPKTDRNRNAEAEIEKALGEQMAAESRSGLGGVRKTGGERVAIEEQERREQHRYAGRGQRIEQRFGERCGDPQRQRLVRRGR